MPQASRTPSRKLVQFLERQGIVAKNHALYIQAMVHRSAINEGISEPDSNERLEFLGDSVLGLLSSQYLFTNFQNLSEGQMARRKGALVSETTLAEWARDMRLGAQLTLGKGEAMTGGREKSAILADAFEALLGAIYLDRGIEAARAFVVPKIARQVEEGSWARADAKSHLQELTQQLYKKPPIYEVSKMEGPDHAKVFEVQVLAQGKVIGEGIGKNKKEAEQKAAEKALIYISKTNKPRT